MHRSRQALATRHPCHVTLGARADVPSLRTVKLVRELERSLRGACDREDFRVVHYSIQSTHVHLVVEARDAAALGRGMKSVGARLARAVNRVFGRQGAVLEGRYHVRALRTPQEVRGALRYLLLNARRHSRRPASRELRLDPASSARWFDGWLGRGRRVAEDVPAVAAGRTWLLREGWRRHGLLDPTEVPGPG